MSRLLIETSVTTVDLKPSPIEPSWIVEGKPFAEKTILSRSADGTATTIVWQCSAGTFDWYYDIDETIYILEGSVILESDEMEPTRYGPGEVVFFKNGAHARWTVEDRIRKLAFCREAQPIVLGLALRIFLRLKRMVMPGKQGKGGSLVGSS